MTNSLMENPASPLSLSKTHRFEYTLLNNVQTFAPADDFLS